MFFISLFLIESVFFGLKSQADELPVLNSYFEEHLDLTEFAKERISEEISLLKDADPLLEEKHLEEKARKKIFVNNYISVHLDLTEFSKEAIAEELDFLKKINLLTDKQINEMQKKYDFHLKEGHRCFNAANKLCKLIPDASDKETAEKLFRFAITTAAGKAVGGYPGVVASLITHLIEYAINSYKEYQQMETYLNEAKYHYEMCAFYKDIIEKA